MNKGFLKKHIISFKNYFKKRNFYYRMLIPYSILSVITICITTGLSWNIVGSKYNSQTKKSNLHILEQVKIYGDQYLYGNLMSLMSEQLNGYTNSDLNKFYFSNYTSTQYDYYKYFQNIVNTCTKNDIIDSITLYRKNSSIIIDSNYGLSGNAANEIELLDNYLPFTFYNEKASGKEKMCLIGIDAAGDTLRPRLTYIHSVPIFSSFDEGNGYIAVTLNEEVFFNLLKELYQFNGQLLVVDKDNQILLDNLADTENRQEQATLIKEKIAGKQTNYDTFHFQGTQYYLSMIESGTSLWKYVSIVPVEAMNAQITATKQLIILLVAIFIFLIICLTHVITSKIYHPLYILRNQILNSGHSMEVKDDISYINDAVNFMEEQIDDMKNTISKNQEILIYKVIMDILYGNNLSEENIKKRLELCKISFFLPFYYILIVEIEDSIYYSLSIEQREYITTKVQAYIQSWLIRDILQITASHPSNNVVTIINSTQTEYEALSSRQGELMDYIKSKIPVNINIAISVPEKKLVALNKIYADTKDYLKYSFVYGYGNIFSPETNQLLENSNLEFSLDDSNLIGILLKNGEIDKAEQILMSYKDKIINEQYSYNSINNFLIQIYSIVFQIGNKQEVFADNRKKEIIIQEFRGTCRFLDSFNCILIILELFRCKCNSDHMDADNILIENIKEYIRVHCYEDLSLTLIAKEFSVSSGHLSRLFKLVTGLNLSVFIINTKLERACELIVEEPALSISTIAAKLGYYTPAYFTRLFKNKYGVTPSQFRKNK